VKIVLNLEVDEDELDFTEEEWEKLSKNEKEFKLTVALNDWITKIDDWSQIWEFEES